MKFEAMKNPMARVALTAVFAASLAVPAYANFYRGCARCADGSYQCAAGSCTTGQAGYVTCVCNAWSTQRGYYSCASGLTCLF